MEPNRHARKYAQGELGENKSFYFRAPDGAPNLRAQNLSTFLQMAAGVDDRIWLHHLKAGEYTRWFRDAIKADEASAVEADRALLRRKAERGSRNSSIAATQLRPRRTEARPCIELLRWAGR